MSAMTPAVTIQGPFEPADFLAVIERWRGEDVGVYGMLYDLRGMTGEPTIADLQQFMSAARDGGNASGPSRRTADRSRASSRR